MATAMRTDRRFQLLYFVFFASYSGLVAFRNVYLKELGMNGFEMGLVGAIWVIGGVVAQPVWGIVADYTGSPSRVLTMAAAISGVSILTYPLGGVVTSSTLLIILVGTVVFSTTQAPIVPIANSLILRRGYDYGYVRSFGSIAFGISILIVGFALASLHTVVVTYVYTLGMVVFVALARGIPREERPAFSGNLGIEALGLVRRRGFALLLGVAFAFGLVNAGSSFFSVYVRAVHMGDWLTGVAWAVKTVVETVVFLWIARVDISYGRQLAISGALYIVGYLVFAFSSSPVLVVVANLLLGAGLAMVYNSLVNAAHGHAPETLQSTAQTLLMGVGIGVGSAVGQLAMGQLVDAVGAQRAYAFLAIGAVGVAVFGVFVRADPESASTPERDEQTA